MSYGEIEPEIAHLDFPIAIHQLGCLHLNIAHDASVELQPGSGNYGIVARQCRGCGRIWDDR